MDLERLLGATWSRWASVSTPPEVSDRQVRAVAAFRAALEVYTREAQPEAWATTQYSLVQVLRDQAHSLPRAEHALLLHDILTTMQPVLEIWTEDSAPLRHADVVEWIAEV